MTYNEVDLVFYESIIVNRIHNTFVDTMHFLLVGMVMGLSAGLAPGPLLTLVISETLQRGVGAGIRVALSPLLTDLPIIVFTLFVLTEISGYHWLLGVISIFGGCLIASMGYGNLRVQRTSFTVEKVRLGSLTKGVLTNLLSPHPYLFWLGVGAPLMGRAMEESLLAVAGFLGGFYLCLVGSKVILAVLVGRSRGLLGSRGYIVVMRLLGLLLFVLAALLFYDGVNLLLQG
ncbi:MAG: LysE family translocator [Desulfopila sp.]